MAQNGSQILNVRLQTSLVEAAQREAERQYMTVSEYLRVALVTMLEKDQAAHHHTAMLYEIAKTRSVMLRFMDTTLTSEQVDKILELAEQDAEGYVKERLEKANDTP